MYWEENEVNQLKTSFFQGLSLKAMAKILNKSPGAVNKALTRFNIRPTKKPKSIWSLSMLNAAPKPHKKKPEPLLTLRETSTWQSSLIKCAQTKPTHHWVHLSEVVSFLTQKGEKITVTGKGPNATYYINRRMMSPTKLLIIANRYRTESRLPPFYVESLTY